MWLDPVLTLFSNAQRNMRVSLVLLAVLASALPLAHYGLIRDQLDAVRYPWGLLPAQFLFLKWFGELSVGFPLGFLVVFALSFSRPVLSRWLFMAGVAMFLIFTVSYLCYSLLVASILLRWIGERP